MSDIHRHDVVIVGSGAAGLRLALALARWGQSIAVVSKGPLRSGATPWAQGGIAAVLDPQGDSFERHIQDTLATGGGLCVPDVVRACVTHAPSALAQLTAWGMPWTTQQGCGLHLTQEGGHSVRRVAHAADATGAALHDTLLAQIHAQPNIHTYPDHMAIDLIADKTDPKAPCYGVHACHHPSGHTVAFLGRATVLATGGASRAYLYSTNPDVASGDGLAMAYRAGCRLVNLEFTQFHPTCAYAPEGGGFLLSEALRGEGAYLRTILGERFVHRDDPRGELAPRDVVARAIDRELKTTGAPYVLLDMRHQGDAFLRDHFPNLLAACQTLGRNMATECIPVVPAAHYTCGGVQADLSGRTDRPHLFAVGEVAHTGLHGANRLASNSLLECLVQAEQAAWAIHDLPALPVCEGPLHWDASRVGPPDERITVAHNWDELRRTMWDYVGIVRTPERLAQALKRCVLIQEEVQEHYAHEAIHLDLLELRNLSLVASLMVQSAQHRPESRGLHHMEQAPEQNNDAGDHTVVQQDQPIRQVSVL